MSKFNLQNQALEIKVIKTLEKNLSDNDLIKKQKLRDWKKGTIVLTKVDNSESTRPSLLTVPTLLESRSPIDFYNIFVND